MLKLGIDYGTTTTLVSCTRQIGGQWDTELMNIGGKRAGHMRSSIPSVIALTRSGEFHIGYKAEEIAKDQPKDTILLRSLKRCLSCRRAEGEKTENCWNTLNLPYCQGKQKFKLFNKIVPVRELISQFLEEVLRLPMVKLIYEDKELNSIGISIPALFKAEPRKTVYDLMLNILPRGMNIEVINEPTAAIVPCEKEILKVGDNDEDGVIYAICDVGGGTTDIVLFEKKKNDTKFFLFDPTGIKIAGDNVDKALLDKLAPRRGVIDWDQALMEVRRAKELLTVSREVSVFGKSFDRNEFQEIVMPVLLEIVEALKEQIKKVFNHYKPTSLTGQKFCLKKIFLSGGGSKIPLLKGLIEQDKYISTFSPEVDFIKNERLYKTYRDNLPIVLVALGASMPKRRINDFIQYMVPFAIWSKIGRNEQEQVPIYKELPVEFTVYNPSHASIQIFAIDPNNTDAHYNLSNELLSTPQTGEIKLSVFLDKYRDRAPSFTFKIDKFNILRVTANHLKGPPMRPFELPWQGGIESALFEKHRVAVRRKLQLDR